LVADEVFFNTGRAKKAPETALIRSGGITSYTEGLKEK
jgi:hypothetical protein